MNKFVLLALLGVITTGQAVTTTTTTQLQLKDDDNNLAELADDEPVSVECCCCRKCRGGCGCGGGCSRCRGGCCKKRGGCGCSKCRGGCNNNCSCGGAGCSKCKPSPPVAQQYAKALKDKKVSMAVDQWKRYMKALKNGTAKEEEVKEKDEKKEVDREKKKKDDADEEEEKIIEDIDEGDREESDKNLPKGPQKTIPQTCDSTLERNSYENAQRFFSRKHPEEYTDASFPADKSSLFYAKSTLTKMKSQYGQVKKWKRPSEIDDEPSLWGEKEIRPSAINQGKLGDCWFLASTSAIAEWGSRIQRIFTNEEYPEDGMFEVNMWLYGQKQRIVIDDKLPMASEDEPINSQSGDNGGWWGPILEKAAAKFFGNYERLNGGWMGEAMYALTGMPGRTIDNSKLNLMQIYKLIKTFDTKNYIMTAANTNTGDTKGLAKGHAFTILGVHEYAGQFLVQVRNPWGKETYTGPWSDSDMTKWNVNAQQQMSHVPNAEDGAFWMPIEEFQKLFKRWHVSMYQEWYRQNLMVEWDRATDEKTLAWEITNKRDQQVVVGVQGPSDKMFMDKTCKSSLKQESIHFELVDAAGKPVKDTSGSVTQHYNGEAFFIYDKLPTGIYHLKVRQMGAKKNTGITKFGVLSYGESSYVDIVEQKIHKK